jgi:hypothetical protein
LLQLTTGVGVSGVRSPDRALSPRCMFFGRSRQWIACDGQRLVIQPKKRVLRAILRARNCGVTDRRAPTARPARVPITLHNITHFPISDRRAKIYWKNQRTLKFWREFAARENNAGMFPFSIVTDTRIMFIFRDF